MMLCGYAFCSHLLRGMTFYTSWCTSQAHFGGDYTDGLYIPARLANDFQLAIMPFRWMGIFHEIAVPAVLGLITDSAEDFEVPLQPLTTCCELQLVYLPESPCGR